MIFYYIFYIYDTNIDNFTNDLNLNIKTNDYNISPRPRVFVPLYAPWRMFYPYDSVYSMPNPFIYQSSPFYPFYDQYNIFQNYIPFIK